MHKESRRIMCALVSDVFTAEGTEGGVCGGRTIYVRCVFAARGSARAALRGTPLTSPCDLWGPVSRDPPKTYYLIYDSHGHYLPATK